MKKLEEINRELRNSAVMCGLCNQWQMEWSIEWNYDRMISQFYRGIDFYLKTRFVDRQFIKENFDIDLLRKNGILVDDTYSLINPEKVILIGNSRSTIRVNSNKSSVIYLTDNAEVKITAKNRSFVIVHALDNATITARQNESARLVIIKHSYNLTILPDTNAVIREEYDYLKTKEGN